MGVIRIRQTPYFDQLDGDITINRRLNETQSTTWVMDREVAEELRQKLSDYLDG